MSNKHLFKKHVLYTILLMLFSTQVNLAQNPPSPRPSNGPGNACPNPKNPNCPDTVPISGFITLGLVAGTIYGIRKVKK